MITESRVSPSDGHRRTLRTHEEQPMTDVISKDQSSERLHGILERGEGTAREFITLQGYAEQFRDRLGYDPYPGTLNVAVDGDHFQATLDCAEPVSIDAWSDGETEFGAVSCYPATVEASSTTFTQCHVIVPDRSDHEDVAEVLAPVRLRDELDVVDGDIVTISITCG